MPVEPQAVLEHLRSKAGKPLKAKELARGLGITAADYTAFRELLKRMESEGTIYRVQRQRFAVPEKINLVVGRLQALRSGAAFVNPENGSPDLFIPAESVGSAVDGDRVVARIERRRAARPEGTVIRVLERARETLVGVYHPAQTRAGRMPGQGLGYVVPEDRRLAPDVIVSDGSSHAAQPGDMVVVRVVDWGAGRRGPVGEIERVLGKSGDSGVDILAIIHGHELPTEFPPEALREAQRLSSRGISDKDLAGREDLRALNVFTIDPADAKDHDDALSITRVGEGIWEVGIHIADVSYYVEEGSPLDTEAVARGTSVYLVDRVLPMLPHELSSDLCSLRPGQDRLTLSLMLHLNEAGAIQKAHMVRSVIRSQHRLTYDEAQAVLDGTASIDPATDAALRQLQALSRALRTLRQERGSLDFDLPEARVILNQSGEPTDIQRVLRLESHRLIEDFMLLANEHVADRAERAHLPFVYRIHEPPEIPRIEQLADLAATFGHRLGRRDRARPKDLQALLASVRGRPEEALLSTAVLRSMKQARYSHENAGHFGLAARRYTHFTSPIRRYPDLLVHRLCARFFLNGEGASPLLADGLETIARLASERERTAVAAERDSVELKKVEFMERHLGDTFDGTISNVRSFGLFVLLDAFHVEGLVHVSSLDDDYYVFVEDRFELVGEHRGRHFRLGDRVRVQVAAIHREERQIDFALEAKSSAVAGKRRSGGRRRNQ